MDNIKKIIFLITVCFCSFCCNSTEKIDKIQQELNKEIGTLLNSNVVNFHIESLRVKKRNIQIYLEIQKPYVSEEKHRALLINFFVNSSVVLRDYENINLIYYQPNEKDFNTRSINYNKQKLKELRSFYVNNPKFVKCIKYIKNNFSQGTTTAYNGSLAVIHELIPKESLLIEFIPLLLNLTKLNSDLDLGTLNENDFYYSFGNLFLSSVSDISDEAIYGLEIEVKKSDIIDQSRFLNELHRMLFNGRNIDLKLSKKSKYWEDYEMIIKS